MDCVKNEIVNSVAFKMEWQTCDNNSPSTETLTTRSPKRKTSNLRPTTEKWPNI